MGSEQEQEQHGDEGAYDADDRQQAAAAAPPSGRGPVPHAAHGRAMAASVGPSGACMMSAVVTTGTAGTTVMSSRTGHIHSSFFYFLHSTVNL